ncbi:MAG: gas vesicle protein [Planctomycetes bacterium]|nr:gas vesicle protein [Planctomycetota bacterium]
MTAIGAPPSGGHPPVDAEERVSLCEALDRILHKGVVISGEVVISVADIDLLYLGLNAVLTSAEKAREVGLITPPKKKPEEVDVFHMPREDDGEDYPGYDRII